jgi:hypothetical protein
MAYDPQMAVRKMHQTTVRFGSDLWEALEEECTRLGVSVAQYLREAALTRLVYAAGRRGDDEFELALELATGREAQPAALSLVDSETVETPAGHARRATERALREGTASSALHAQGRLARQRARVLRERAARYRNA